MLRSLVVGSLVTAATFSLAGAASADVTQDPTASCSTTVVCAPVGVPILTIDRVLSDLLHLGTSS